MCFLMILIEISADHSLDVLNHITTLLKSKENKEKILLFYKIFFTSIIITKVENFDELMDARNTLNKPIIYCKINDIKSEFIVEDDERIYKYVMKESDFTN